MSQKPVKIRDVANHAGVSIATASRVLNNVPSVNEKLAERVRKAAQELCYIPNISAKNLRSRKSSIWAAVIPDAKNPFYISLIEAIENLAWQSGYQVMFCNSREEVERESFYIREIAASRLAGAIVSVVSENRSSVEPLINANIPTVLIDRTLKDFSGITIQTDNRKIGELAAAHLTKNGARKFLCITGPVETSNTEMRTNTFINEIKRIKSGCKNLKIEVLRTDLKGSERATKLARILRSADSRPDAIFTVNGPLTGWAYRSIKNSGLLMPNEISLIGVDDEPWMRMVDTPLSIVAQPAAEIGSLAAKILSDNNTIEKISSGTITLAPKLKLRVSSTNS